MSYKRSRENKRRYAKLHKIAVHYPSPVWYKDRIWIKGVGYVANPKPYYERLYKSGRKCSRYYFCRKYANRQVRRYKGIIPNGGGYKKAYDFWWEVF